MKHFYKLLVLACCMITPFTLLGQDSTTKPAGDKTGTQNPKLTKEAVTKKAAEDFFSKGEQLRKYKDFRDAILEFDKAMTLDPTNHKYPYSKAICHFSLRDTMSTIAMLEKAVGIKEDFVNAHVLLAKAYTMVKDAEKAAKSFEKAAQYEANQPKQVAYLANALKILSKEKKHSETIALSEKILKTDAGNVNALYYAAQAYNATEQYQKAVNCMASATGSIESSSPQRTAKLYYELGYAYHQLGNYDKSQEAFKNASFGPYKALIAKLTPDFYYNVAFAYFKVLDYESAIENIKTALKMKQSFSKAHLLQGEIALKKEKHDDAIPHYLDALEGANKSKKLEVYSTVVELMFNTKQYDKALKVCNQALLEFQGNHFIQFHKALCMYRLQNLQEAAIELETLVKNASNPTEMVTYCFALGLVYADMKDVNNARKYFKEAAKGPFTYAAQQEYEKLKDAMASAQSKNN